MALTSYTDLRNAIINLAEDTSAEFASYLETGINLAEARLFRLLDIDFSRDVPVTISPGINTVDKPGFTRFNHDFFITVGSERRRLIRKTDSFIRDYWPNSLSTGVPKYYAQLNETQFILAPTPDTTYAGTVHISNQPTLLSDSNSTNVILEKYPDVLLMASMQEMCSWMKDVERTAEWAAKVKESIDTINNEGMRNRTDDATNANNPQGGQNNLVKGQT